eukprot:SAG11_NODE_14421_length_612_cov_2.522417_1_plen_95_part_00
MVLNYQFTSTYVGDLCCTAVPADYSSEHGISDLLTVCVYPHTDTTCIRVLGTRVPRYLGTVVQRFRILSTIDTCRSTGYFYLDYREYSCTVVRT